MEMKKIACAVLVAAATATGALAAEAPAPGPASGAASLPAVGAALGVAVLSFVACYLQSCASENLDSQGPTNALCQSFHQMQKLPEPVVQSRYGEDAPGACQRY
ncbi:hypothetical protein ZIOFF_043160 [Zingiber officinale]|uniref:Uncharacterized protein n=1 Tax=Zingiber officinale TaxID=94328 RepID=A0A8J5KW31_ZINOF|nr:hypothetical protein ZIOFF_043160 [Zingiber officinale]